MFVYQLTHQRKVEYDNKEQKWIYCGKTIGYYSTRENAEKTIEKCKTIEGFRDYPDDFVIEEYEVDFDDFDFI